MVISNVFHLYWNFCWLAKAMGVACCMLHAVCCICIERWQLAYFACITVISMVANWGEWTCISGSNNNSNQQQPEKPTTTAAYLLGDSSSWSEANYTSFQHFPVARPRTENLIMKNRGLINLVFNLQSLPCIYSQLRYSMFACKSLINKIGFAC